MLRTLEAVSDKLIVLPVLLVFIQPFDFLFTVNQTKNWLVS